MNLEGTFGESGGEKRVNTLKVMLKIELIVREKK
jgi:hypothetical protein